MIIMTYHQQIQIRLLIQHEEEVYLLEQEEQHLIIQEM